MLSSATSEHEGDSGVESTHSSSGESFMFFRVSVPDMNVHKCLQFNPEETVWVAKQQILATLAKDLKDGLNYGLFCPPVNGRAGKFMDEERLLKDYSLPGPIAFLEFIYKRRVYKQASFNQRKVKQLQTKANMKQFYEAVRKSDVEKVTKMMSKGLDPNFQDHDSGETPLTLATSLSRPRSVIMALVDGGAIVDYRNRSGLTPVHRAAKGGNTEAATTLLDLGAGVNYRDQRGLTPLYHCVCHSTNGTCVNLLLYNYAVIGTTDNAGWTELHQACKAGHVQHVEQLLFYGAEMNQQNAGGNTPLHICAINNQDECARTLLFRGADRLVKNFANQTATEVAIIANNFQLSDLINNFSTSDIVLIQEIPTYNTKRRASSQQTGPSNCNMQRCSSNPQLYSRNSFASSDRFHPTSGCSFQAADQYRSPLIYARQQRFSSCTGEQLNGYDSDSLHSMSVSSAGSLPGSAGDVEPYGYTTQFETNADTTSVPRTVRLLKGSHGFGFVLRGAKSESGGFILDFVPTAQCPGLQYIEHVDPGSAADGAGLKAGDYITEINGVSVVYASHERAVQVIRNAADQLVLTVITVAAKEISEPQVAANRLTMTPGFVDFHQRSVRNQPVVSESRTWRGLPGALSRTDVNLSRFGSVPSLTFDNSGRSVPSRSRPPLNGRPQVGDQNMVIDTHHIPAEVLYSVPVKSPTTLSSGPTSPAPPVPPPPEFRLRRALGAEVIPISTKVSHTYANVSQWISSSSSSSTGVESSFRPGTSAHLSQDDTIALSTMRRTSAGQVAEIAQTLARDGVSEQRIECQRETNGEKDSGVIIELDTWRDENLPPPPPPLPALEDFTLFKLNATSTEDQAVRAAPPLLSLDSELPSASSLHKTELREEAKPISKSCGDEIRKAVALRREFVEALDMEDVAATIEQRVLRARPLQRVLYKADQTKQVFRPAQSQSPSSWSALTDSDSCSRASVPPVVDRKPATNSNSEMVRTGGEASSNFLAMAERARQEYIKRRVSCIEQDTNSEAFSSSSSSSRSEPMSSFAQMIAEKAMQRRRHTVIGDVDDDCVDVRESTSPAAIAGSSYSPDDDRRSLFTRRLLRHDGGFEKSTLMPAVACHTKSNAYGATGCSEQPPRVASGDDVVTFTPDYDTDILPPPPDFCSSSSDFAGYESSDDVCLGNLASADSCDFGTPTPLPPPGFNDDSRSGSSRSTDDILRSPVSSWTVGDVACWLDSVQMSEFRDHFVECGIDGARLTKLGRAELIALGVTQVGQRMNLERAIKRALISIC